MQDHPSERTWMTNHGSPIPVQKRCTRRKRYNHVPVYASGLLNSTEGKAYRNGEVNHSDILRDLEDPTKLGGTYKDSGLPPEGYLVSFEDTELRFRRESREYPAGRFRILSALESLRAQRPDACVGWWQDGDFVYVDSSDVHYDREAALNMARRRNQLAIWDCAGKQEIRVT